MARHCFDERIAEVVFESPFAAGGAEAKEICVSHLWL